MVCHQHPRATRQKPEQGAVAIEFAALFVLFFALFYGVLAYSVPFFLTLSYKHLSAEAARSAIRVDPALSRPDYVQAISQQVTETIGRFWEKLPDDWIDGGCSAPNDNLPWQPLPPVGGWPSFGHLAAEEIIPGNARYLLHVCIQRRYGSGSGARERAIVPIVVLGPLTIPSLPTTDGETVLRASTITAL